MLKSRCLAPRVLKSRCLAPSDVAPIDAEKYGKVGAWHLLTTLRNELATRIAEVERLATHVSEKSGADTLARIAEWRKRISEIADVDY